MKLTYFATAFVMMATAAIANDHLVQIRDHAGKLAREYREIGSVVKSKNFNQADLQSRLSAVNADVDRLKQLAGEFESSNSQLAGHDDWKRTKTLVDLIALFHTEKSNLLADQPHKKRSLLKSHAEGLAMRATKLEASSSKLLRSMSSPAGF